MKRVVSLAVLSLLLISHSHNAVAALEKEWTFMVFLNGNNNLDDLGSPFGHMNMNQMEEVGSTDQVNVVVQWASMGRDGNTQRVYVEKDTDTVNVTSKAVQDLGKLDMGDPKAVVDFVEWSKQNYPAKKYFLVLWNHGSGWHDLDFGRAPGIIALSPPNISFDDYSKNNISTPEMGVMLEQIHQVLGKKLDILGADACLMAMAEVASEVADHVSYMAASQENEPGEGWPYAKFLGAWQTKGLKASRDVASLLVDEFIASYSPGGVYGQKAVTFSAWDLSKIRYFENTFKKLSLDVQAIDVTKQAEVATSARDSLNFFLWDYVDYGDFLSKLEVSKVGTLIPSSTLSDARRALSQLMISAKGTERYSTASGVSFWYPTSEEEYSKYIDEYKTLKFHKLTGWGDALSKAFPKVVP